MSSHQCFFDLKILHLILSLLWLNIDAQFSLVYSPCLQCFWRIAVLSSIKGDCWRGVPEHRKVTRSSSPRGWKKWACWRVLVLDINLWKACTYKCQNKKKTIYSLDIIKKMGTGNFTKTWQKEMICEDKEWFFSIFFLGWWLCEQTDCY